jgi:diguanylate cyclase (GGDEF)-like protein
LRRLVLTDKLTGLPNRACLTDLLKKCAARVAGDPAFNFAVLFLDFDRFKSINDRLGHDAGDALLIQIAERLRQLLGQGDFDDGLDGRNIAVRLGGDEFVVLQQGAQSVDDSVQLAEKILKCLDVSYDLGGHDVFSTASIGIAASQSVPQGTDILRSADSAMYRAKALGKSRYVLFSPEMLKDALDSLTLENDLRHALPRGELLLHYQPIVSLNDAHLVGFEALLRWAHPKRGLIQPLDFIPLSEETGLILPIGQWVVEEACRQLHDWKSRIPAAANLKINVNCSRKQLVDPALVNVVSRALATHHLSAGALNLEITESIMMEQQEKSRDVMLQLKSLGLRLHMDDFGTGYSSLSCLHDLPLDVLKIDRSFIKSMGRRRDYAAVIDAIILLAHNLGIQVVAEGVETADHAAMLCALDCDFAQGYFFAKPLPADEAEQFITTGHKQLSPQPT